LSSNHFIDDDRVIFYYDAKEEEKEEGNIYKSDYSVYTKANNEKEFLIDGAVRFFTTSNKDHRFEFTDKLSIIATQDEDNV
jgi:hypothetical protein